MSLVNSPVTHDARVTLHFSLALENGDIVDSNFGKKPATFSMGDGSLLPGFEKHLVGLVIGDKRRFTIPQQDSFGAVNPQNVQTFKRSVFSNDVELVEGLIVSFADAAGNELPGVVKKIHASEVDVDFNHPLAGRTIIFTVEIIDVQ